MRKSLLIVSITTLSMLVGCSKVSRVHICTTADSPWQSIADTTLQNSQAADILTLHIDSGDTCQVIEGFGACFNELGWDALALLSDTDRQNILSELFLPDHGANFTVCRMPIGANDFSRAWYSYAEPPGDFAMQHFSIDHDRETLIPFILSAQKLNPQLSIWASPWCPPAWMKLNGHYASRYQRNCRDDRFRNGLLESQEGHEGSDMFRMDSLHLQAYATYFQKFIRAYRDAGIDIFAVMPQNEFNSAQVFPSCVWTARSLARFVGQYLGPVMEQEGVEVMFGTVERANALLVDTVLQDVHAKKYISGVGFQWAGRGAIATVRTQYPHMRLLQTEQECGDGKNDRKGLVHSWNLLKHFIDNGVSVYDYWNMALLEGGVSRWGWAQNSLVVVDSVNHSYRWTPEFYLMKHVSHFVVPGARYIRTSGDGTSLSLTFLNPDGRIAVVMAELEGRDRWIRITRSGMEDEYVFLRGNSLNTVLL
mgnify:FL=1